MSDQYDVAAEAVLTAFDAQATNTLGHLDDWEWELLADSIGNAIREAVEREREECAQKADELFYPHIAAAIRARGGAADGGEG